MDTEAVTIESTNKVFGGRSAASKAVDAFVACAAEVAASTGTSGHSAKGSSKASS